jgi:hypothetical protein
MRELLLDAVKDVGGDQCRDGNPKPFLARAIAIAKARTHRQQRRLAVAGRHAAGAVAISGPGVGRVLQDAPHTRHIPAWLAGGCEHAQLGEAQGNSMHGGSGLKIPREHLLDDGGGGRVEAQAGGIARMLGIKVVAKGCAAPWQELACPQGGQAPATHPVTDQRALVLGDRPANLQQQLVVRILTHRPLHKLDGAAMGLEFPR